MPSIARLLGTTIIAALVLSAGDARATRYSLWIHGRHQGTQIGNYNDWSAWGSASVSAGVNKKAVNWDGKSSIASTNGNIRNALDCYCTGANWCYIAAHSAGDLQIGYALANYGGSARYKKNATPNASGVCGNTDGTTQTGWNIYWVDVASGAGGGSELANIGQLFTGLPLDNDLKTGNARALYNHNTTRSRTFNMFAASNGSFYSATLPGQDDDAVSYHSTGGVAVTGSFCNPGDWFCDGTLTTGSGATSNGKAKWSYHTVRFRDDGEAYAHGANGSWANIVGVVRADMATYAT